MNKRDFDAEMQGVIKELDKNGKRARLLLHACCAPCLSGAIDKLTEFDTTVYFYNPNIDGKEEYDKRANEIVKLSEVFGFSYIIEEYDKDDFYGLIKGLENEPERGKRCEKCFYLRLNKTAEYGKENGFDFFATTLTLSPLKNPETVNSVGEAVGKENGIAYLLSDFKKRDGYLKSIKLSKEYGLYRQNYCGCEFSKR